MSKDVKVWRLKAKMDARFRAGHPWVYSNELQESPKGVEPGQPIELCDAAGKFLARGYGNPHSLIAFRALSRDPEIEQPGSPEAITRSLTSAGRMRALLGLADVSHRLCFGEADFLPGLVIDRYVLPAGAQAFAVQMHTAGMDRLQSEILSILKSYCEFSKTSWEKTAVILRNDLSIRKLEGIEPEQTKVLREVSGVDLQQVKIKVMPGPMEFSVDLVGGQKTGFFLDQCANVELAAIRLKNFRPENGRSIRILDICCYVGQWSAQLARVFKAQGLEVEVSAADSSATALERAKRNIEANGARCAPIKIDVLSGLASLPEQSFDIVVCDPPALIQGRKDIPAGTHAYLQLNTQAFRLVKRPGAVVSSSCSGLLEEDAFLKTLSKAAYRNHARVRWVARGSQSPDHPVLTEFSEGRYLKCMIGLVE